MCIDGKQFSEIDNPQFLKADLERLRDKSKVHSCKKQGSKNRKRAKKELGKVHQAVSNRRSDWQWKKVHELCRAYKFIGLEDLFTWLPTKQNPNPNPLGLGVFQTKLSKFRI